MILKFLACIRMHVVLRNEIRHVGVKDKSNFVHVEIAIKGERVHRSLSIWMAFWRKICRLIFGECFTVILLVTDPLRVAHIWLPWKVIRESLEPMVTKPRGLLWNQDNSKDPHIRHSWVFILNLNHCTFFYYHCMSMCYGLGTKLSIFYALCHATLTKSRVSCSVIIHIYKWKNSFWESK